MKQDYPTISRLKFCSELFAIIIALMGFIMFLGWALDITVFKTPGPYFSAIKN